MSSKAKGLGQRVLIVIGIVVLAFILLKLVFNVIAVAVWITLVVLCALGILWLASKL